MFPTYQLLEQNTTVTNKVMIFVSMIDINNPETNAVPNAQYQLLLFSYPNFLAFFFLFFIFGALFLEVCCFVLFLAGTQIIQMILFYTIFRKKKFSQNKEKIA